MVAKASNLLAMGDFYQFGMYAVAYVCFVLGACLGGVVINVRACACVYLLVVVGGLGWVDERVVLSTSMQTYIQYKHNKQYETFYLGRIYGRALFLVRIYL